MPGPRVYGLLFVMTETLLSFPIDIGDVLDVDFRPDGSLLSIQGFGKRQILALPEGTTELPSSWPAPEFPHLRWLSEGRLLLIDTSNQGNSGEDEFNGNNAFIIDESGRLLNRFHVGTGVVEAVPTADSIAVAYHPDAAHELGLEVGAMANAGVAIFDSTGGIIASLNNDLGQEGWQATNIQCMVPRESGELILIPEFLTGSSEEIDSPIIFYDWRSGRIRIESTDLSRPLAMSCKDNLLMIYSPEHSEDELIACDIHGREIKSLGFYSNIYRGLVGGRFLAQLSGVEYNLLEIEPELPLKTEKPVRLSCATFERRDTDSRRT